MTRPFRPFNWEAVCRPWRGTLFHKHAKNQCLKTECTEEASNGTHRAISKIKGFASLTWTWICTRLPTGMASTPTPLSKRKALARVSSLRAVWAVREPKMEEAEVAEEEGFVTRGSSADALLAL